MIAVQNRISLAGFRFLATGIYCGIVIAIWSTAARRIVVSQQTCEALLQTGASRI